MELRQKTRIAGVTFGAFLVAASLGLCFSTRPAGAAGSGERLHAQEVESAQKGQVYEGMITCSRCGAKHSPDMKLSADTCVRVCVHGGANFVLVNPDASYILDGDLGALKKLSGQRVRVVGTIEGRTIKVSSAEAS